MKLKVTDWKQAWFESHISDRFFQEMAKLEKGSVQGLETTAQWMEQIVIEVGLLAQAMIRLEQQGAPEPQIRQAYDKAMRVAALSLHLITALDGEDREQIRATSIVRRDHDERPPARYAPAAPKPLAQPAPLSPQTQPATEPPVPAAEHASSRGMPGLAMLTHASALRRPPPMPVAPRPPTDSKGARPRKGGANPAHHANGRNGADAAVPDGRPGVGPNPSTFASLVQVSGRNVPRSENAVRQTIVSLSQQGLSRAEIEVVTGEQRHIIEAVLNHARNEAQAGSGQV